MPKCSEIMTPDPVSIEADQPIKRAAVIMKQHDVGAVPVVDAPSSRRLTGIVTDRDIVVKVVAGERGVEQATVRDAMTGSPVACRLDDDIEQALKIMSERQVRRIPVVDDAGRLCGIIAQADVATRINRDKQTGELVEAISEPGTVRK
jgi:CBS domain-containing protein